MKEMQHVLVKSRAQTARTFWYHYMNIHIELWSVYVLGRSICTHPNDWTDYIGPEFFKVMYTSLFFSQIFRYPDLIFGLTKLFCVSILMNATAPIKYWWYYYSNFSKLWSIKLHHTRTSFNGYTIWWLCHTIV